MIYTSKHHIAVATGMTIQEKMEDNRMTPEELAFKLNLSMNDFNKLMNGEISLSQDIADKLEEIFHVIAGYWIQLDKEFQFKKKLVHDENLMKKLRQGITRNHWN